MLDSFMILTIGLWVIGIFLFGVGCGWLGFVYGIKVIDDGLAGLIGYGIGVITGVTIWFLLTYSYMVEHVQF